jgi:hypothetical protein
VSTELATVSMTAVPPAFGGLSPRLTTFVNHYIQTSNGVESAMVAFGITDYSTAGVTAHRLLKKPKIRLEIERRLGVAVASSQEVLERLTQQARADLGEILEPDGSFDVQRAKRRGKSRLLKKIKYDKDTGKLVELEIHDPQAALEKLGRFHKLFTDRIETSDGPGDPTRLASDLTAVLGVVREAIEAYRVATQAQLVQHATESSGSDSGSGGLIGPSSSQPIIDITPTANDDK